MVLNRSVLKHLSVVLMVICGTLLKAEVSPDAGKTLFTANCAACHAKNMKSALQVLPWVVQKQSGTVKKIYIPGLEIPRQ